MDASWRLLVEAAVARFAEDGRHGVSPHDLVKRLGMPAAEVFRRFPDRDRLFAAVLGQVQQELFAHIEASCPVIPGESGLSMILRLAEAYSRFLEERPAGYRDILPPGEKRAVGAGNQGDRELARLAARIAKQFEVLLLLGRLDGSVRAEAATDTAWRMVHVVAGTVRLSLTSPRARTRNLRGMLAALAGGQAPARAA